MDDVPPATEDLSNKILHVLMPRNTRNAVEISVPSYVPSESISSAIGSSLKQTMDSSHIEIMQFSQMESEYEDGVEKTAYTVIFLNIPNELIDKLHVAGVKKCIFYVGWSENTNEFPVLDTKPLPQDIALTNREGLLSPYMSELIEF